MAILEQVVVAGPGYSFAFVLDDVAQQLIGVHAINNSGSDLQLVFVFNGVDRSRRVPDGVDSVVNLPVPKPYVIGVSPRGQPNITIPGLGSIGVQSL